MKMLEVVSFLVFVAVLLIYIPARIIFGVIDELSMRLNKSIGVH